MFHWYLLVGNFVICFWINLVFKIVVLTWSACFGSIVFICYVVSAGSSSQLVLLLTLIFGWTLSVKDVSLISFMTYVCADDVQMMCRQHADNVRMTCVSADDMQMTLGVVLHEIGQLMQVSRWHSRWHMSSASEISPEISLSYHLHIICMSSACHLHVIHMSSTRDFNPQNISS